MSTELLRKYIDIINEAEERQQLDEGIVGDLMSKAKDVASRIGENVMSKIADFVSSALNKPIEALTIADLNRANARRIADAAEWEKEGGSGHEYAEVPGSYVKNKAAGAVGGGVLGAVMGAIGAGSMTTLIHGLGSNPNTGLVASFLVPLMAIALAIIFAAQSGPDVAMTGRFKDDRGKITDIPANRSPELGRQ